MGRRRAGDFASESASSSPSAEASTTTSQRSVPPPRGLLESGRVRALRAPSEATLSFERASDLALVLAYVISVCLYIHILAAFVLGGFYADTEMGENLLTTVVIATIMVIGVIRGLKALEVLEEWALVAGCAPSRPAGCPAPSSTSRPEACTRWARTRGFLRAESPAGVRSPAPTDRRE